MTDVFEKNNIELPTIEDADEKDNPPIVARFTNGDWDWYVLAGEKIDNGDYLLYGLVDGIHKELGTFTLSQIEDVSATLTSDFESIGLYDLKSQLWTPYKIDSIVIIAT